MDSTAHLSPEAKEFVRRLRQEMAKRDWNGAELARQAALHMPDQKFGRDLITRYRRGAKPRDAHLVAMASALNMKPGDLYPGMWNPITPKAVAQPVTHPANGNTAGGSTLDILPNGKVRLRIDEEVDLPLAAKVLEALARRA